MDGDYIIARYQFEVTKKYEVGKLKRLYFRGFKVIEKEYKRPVVIDEDGMVRRKPKKLSSAELEAIKKEREKEREENIEKVRQMFKQNHPELFTTEIEK